MTQVEYFRDSKLADGAVWEYTTKKLWCDGYYCGYRELPLHYRVKCSDNRWRRLYAYPIGNSSVLYVKHKGKKLYVSGSDLAGVQH